MRSWARRRPTKWPLRTVAAMLPVIAVTCGPTGLMAQDRGITTAPIDERAPDVIAFRNRASEAPSGVHAEAIKEGLPPDQFFASLNGDAPLMFGEQPVPSRISDEKCTIERMDWDPSPRRAHFWLKYAAPCDVALNCNWIEDAESRASEAEIAEQQLEVGGESENSSVPRPETAEVFDPADDHLMGYPEISITFKLAGRRSCRLTRYCTGPEDPNCNEEYLRIRASQISIDQLGK